MCYNEEKIAIKGLTEENAEALKKSHEGYGNPVYTGTVEIVKEYDDSYTANYDRCDVNSFQKLHEDTELYGGHTDILYQ